VSFHDPDLEWKLDGPGAEHAHDHLPALSRINRRQPMEALSGAIVDRERRATSCDDLAEWRERLRGQGPR
jgi:hypothetical protein